MGLFHQRPERVRPRLHSGSIDVAARLTRPTFKRPSHWHDTVPGQAAASWWAPQRSERVAPLGGHRAVDRSPALALDLPHATTPRRPDVARVGPTSDGRATHPAPSAPLRDPGA